MNIKERIRKMGPVSYTHLRHKAARALLPKAAWNH